MTAELVYGSDWSLNRETFNRDQIIRAYFHTSQLRIVSRWSHVAQRGKTTVDDLKGVAVDALVDVSTSWPAWCERNDVDPTNKVTLLRLLNKVIDYRVFDYLGKYTLADNSLEGMANENGEEMDSRLWRTRLWEDPFSRSQTHLKIAEYIATMRAGEQVVLALRFHDELPVATVATLLHTNVSGASGHIARATAKVLAYARTEVLTNPEERPTSNTRGFIPGDHLVAWIQAHYGVGLDAYLAYTAVCYRQDVTPIIDMLDRGHGGNQGHNSPLIVGSWGKLADPEQQADIQARLAAGETHTAIAAVHDVTPSAISYQAKKRATA